MIIPIIGGIARIGGFILGGLGLGKVLDFFQSFTGTPQSPSNNSAANIILTVTGLLAIGALGFIVYKKVLK